MAAVISGLSPDFGIGMVEVLTALEAGSSQLGSEADVRGSSGLKLIKIHRSTAQLVKRMDGDAYIVVNTIFHEAIYDGARNTFLKEQLTLTRRRMRSYHRSSLTKPARVRASWEEHAAVADADRQRRRSRRTGGHAQSHRVGWNRVCRPGGTSTSGVRPPPVTLNG